MPNSCAIFHTYVMLIQTVYRTLLTSAVSEIGHRIHTPKKNRRILGKVISDFDPEKL